MVLHCEGANLKSLCLVPINLKEANEFVSNFHRHNYAVQGCKFCIGVSDFSNLVGVAIVGRPISLHKDNGTTAEVRRVCVLEDAPKGANSFLYSACWRAWKAMGGTRIITYTLQSESGSSLKGAGWKVLHESKGVNHKGWQSRPGRTWQPIIGQDKFCFYKENNMEKIDG